MKTVNRILLAVVASLALSGSALRADTHTYTSTRRVVNVGIVVSAALNRGNLGSEDPDPHVFYVADARQDLKPLGMDFVNPLAPPVVTGEIYQRWQQRQISPDPAFVAGSAQSRVFTVGSRVTKNMGAYWEVNIDNLSEDSLAKFDLLYIHSHMRNITFTGDVLAKLRRFVDGGGTLWIENCGGMTFNSAAPFLYDVQMHSGVNGASGAVIATPNHPLLTYPFVLSPFDVQSLGDKFVNDFYLFRATPNGADSGETVPGSQVLAPVVWNTRGLAPASVVKPNPGWRPYIAAGQVGAGHIIFSSEDSGCAINDYVGGADAGYGGNSAVLSGDSLLSVKPADLKFVYNLAAWTTSATTALTNVRHDGRSPEQMAAQLVDKWSAPVLAGTNKVGGAIYYKHCVFSVDGNLVLHCFDARPEEDLDGDGNPDDGVPDFILGAPYDEVWNLPLAQYGNSPTGSSTPTVAEFYDPNYIPANGDTSSSSGGGVTLANFNQRELVIVTLSDGTVVAVRAFPRVAAQGLPMAPATRVEWVCKFGVDYGINNSPHSIADPDAAQDLQIPAPAWSEGVVFAAINTQNGGRLLSIDPHNGLSAFYPGPNGYGGLDSSTSEVPNLNGGPPTPAYWGGPTVGYVRDQATGAIDKMVYVFATKTAGSPVPETVQAFWFGARGEPLTRIGISTWQSRASRPWYLYDPAAPGNGNPLLRQRVFHTYADPVAGVRVAEELTYDPAPGPGVPQPGFFKVEFVGGVVRVLLNAQQNPNNTATDDPRNSYYCDYTFDWQPQDVNAPRTLPRSVFIAPDPTQAGSQIGGPPALSSDDLVYYAAKVARPAASSSAGGVLFAVQEQANGNALKWAYAMHDGFQITLNGTVTTITPRLRQMDPGLPFFGQYITNVQYTGTPAIANGVTYAVARGEIASGGGGQPYPVSVLCAFAANPEFVLHLPAPVDPGTAVRIRQVNLYTAQPTGLGANAVSFVDLTPSQYTLDYLSGVVHINSMAPNRNVVGFVSASMPFIVKVGTGPDIIIYGQKVDNFGGGQQTRLVGPEGIDNLLWYAVLPAASANQWPTTGYVSSSPSVIGNVVWLGFQFGYIASLDADPTATDPQFQTTGSQVPLFTVAGSASPGHLRWVHRVYDPALNSVNGGAFPSVVAAPMGTSGLLLANTFNGARTMEDTYTVVADANRLIEVNAAGEAVWSSDATRSYTVTGGDLPQYVLDPGTGNIIIANPAQATGVPTINAVSYAHPTVARPIGTSDLLVVDTGNNRVVQVDHGGNVVWEVNRLFDDFKHALRPGDPTSLNEPSDIQYWQEFQPALQIQTQANGVAYSYNGPAYIIHYLIADTGNFRVVELVDVYDQTGRPVVPANGGTPAPFAMLRQVNFVSSSYGSQGSRYRYRSVQRLNVQNGSLGSLKDPGKANNVVRLLTLSAVSNARLTGAGAIGVNQVDPSGAGQVVQPEAGGGSLVVLDENGNPISVVSSLRIPKAGGFFNQPLVNPTWFSAFIENTAQGIQYKYLVADDNGCYQLRPGVDPITNGPIMVAEWVLSADDYYRMTGKRLQAASIRRLTAAVTDNSKPSFGLHHFLIANKFSGQDNPLVFGIGYNGTGNPNNGNIAGPADFHGEVFEVDPTAFDITNPQHGYIQDYADVLNALVPNDGAAHIVGNTLVNTVQASIIFRTPTETVPRPPDSLSNPGSPFAGDAPGYIKRSIGSTDRSTSAAPLEQPAYADRPF